MISIRRNLNWVSLIQLVRIVFQIVTISLMARLLMPSDYGLMAITTSIFVLANLFKDFGTGIALLQKKEIDQKLVDAVFSFNILLGIFLALIVSLTSLPFSVFVNNQDVAGLILAMSPVFVIGSFAIVPSNLLEREMRFKRLLFTEILSSSVGLLLGVLAAWRGLGAYSLVIQSISVTFISTVLLYVRSDFRLEFKFSILEVRNVWRFSFDNFIFGVANYVNRNSDVIIIGRTLSPGEVGIYSTAYKILLLPLTYFTYPLNRASFIAYSRNQDSKSEIALHYLKNLRRISIMTALLMGSLWALREPFILLAMGKNWLQAADLLFWFAPIGFLQSVVSTSGMVFNSIGRSDLLKKFGIVAVPLHVICFLLGVRYGIEGVAIAYLIINIIWFFPIMISLFNLLDLSLKNLFKMMIHSFLLGVIVSLLLRAMLLSTEWAKMMALNFS